MGKNNGNGIPPAPTPIDEHELRKHLGELCISNFVLGDLSEDRTGFYLDNSRLDARAKGYDAPEKNYHLSPGSRFHFLNRETYIPGISYVYIPREKSVVINSNGVR